ncbi:MAG: PaaI family thioesterase [Burkholderiales bacterium]|nr:PaaI family thioesterase [Burkholderiales bacterium]
MTPPEPRRVIRPAGAAAPHGVVDPAEVAHLSGLEFFEAWADGRLPPPPIGKTLNFALVEAEYGRAVFAGEPLAEFYNPIGSVHGSYAAALLDSAMGCAVHTCMAAGQAYTTLEYKISLVRGMTSRTGRVVAEGRILQVGRRVATAEGRLTDAAGKLLAHGTTTCLVFEV